MNTRVMIGVVLVLTCTILTVFDLDRGSYFALVDIICMGINARMVMLNWNK